jgi:uncharacterized protein
MTDLFANLASAFLLGLLGSGHCLGMCGGLMGALSLGSVPGKGRHLGMLLGYNLGRVLSYGMAGLLLGGAGWAVGDALGLLPLRLLAGALLVCMGSYLAGWWHGLLTLERLGQGLWRHLRPFSARLLPVRSPASAWLLGAIWGWLPCGLVYSALGWAAAQGSTWRGAALMVAFGLGTTPLLLLSATASTQARRWLNHRRLRTAMGVLVIAFGAWTLLATLYHGLPHLHHPHGHSAAAGGQAGQGLGLAPS